jgi:hypothetical protein
MMLQYRIIASAIAALCFLLGGVSGEVTYVTAALKTDGFGAQLLAKLSCMLHAGASKEMYYVHTPFKVGCGSSLKPQ